MVLTAYFDDSREYRDGWGLHAIAGYLATTEFWESDFAPRWKQLLDSAPHKISEWKTSDCRSGKGEYRDWARQELNAFTVKAVDAILHYPYGSVIGFGTVYLAAERIVDHKRAQQFEQHALRTGLMNIAGAICRYAMINRGADEIRFVCDSQKGWEGRLTDLWDTVVLGNNSNSLYPGKLNRLSFDDSKEVFPLQAADLFAYEIRKDVRDRIERPQFPRSMALHRLVNGQPHLGFYIDQSIIEERITAREEGRPLPGPAMLFHSGHLQVEWDPPVKFLRDPRPPR